MGTPSDVDQKLVKQGRCGRWKKGKKSRCRAKVKIKGNGCKFHGGNARKGPDHWNYEGKGKGRYDVPEKLQASYERFLEADVSLHAEIALSRSLIQTTLEDLEAGIGQGWRQAIGDVRDRMARAVKTKDTDTFQVALSDLDDLVKQGARIDHATRELLAHQRTLREMVDTEVRRLKFDGAPAEEVIAFGYQLLSLARDAIRMAANGTSPGEAEAQMVSGFRSLLGDDSTTVN